MQNYTTHKKPRKRLTEANSKMTHVGNMRVSSLLLWPHHKK